VICAVCREQFTDYYEHIFSCRHKKGVANNQAIFNQIDSIINEVDEHQKEKERCKVTRLLLSPDASCINNPEEAAKLKLCVNTEDTSSGSTAINKITAPTEEAIEDLQPKKAVAEQNLGSIFIDLDEVAKPARGAKRARE
jgi:hypothetical protein